MESQNITISLLQKPCPKNEISDDDVGYYYPKHSSHWIKTCKKCYYIGCGIFCCCICSVIFIIVIMAIGSNQQ